MTLHRRGFALPLVALLVLVMALVLVVVIERSTIGYLAGRRQIAVYTDHHRAAGMKEIVNRWLETSRDSIPDMLDGDGRAFDLDIGDGQRVVVFLDPAQGSALSDPGQVVGRRREIVEDTVTLLKRRFPTGGDALADPSANRQFLRPLGPPEIDVNTAPEEVLEALLLAITEPRRASPLLKDLIRRRGDADLKPDDIQKVLTESDLDRIEQAEVRSMLTASPSLWRAVTETRRGERVVDRSGGYLLVDGTSRTGGMNQSGLFLSWESIKTDGPLRRGGVGASRGLGSR